MSAVQDPKKLGNETRSSVLPTAFAMDEMLGPNYDFAEELPTPSQVGVSRGKSLSSVVKAGTGAAYYADMIGFGNPSNVFTRGMGRSGPKPMGINYFVRTPTKCSNGADMWIYVNGIPKGDMFGKKIQQAIRELGVPALQGLAPGMIEDVKAGLDPRGVTNAIFGSGYMQCKQVTLPVGDVNGRIKSSDGVQWIKPIGPNDIKPGPRQTRWVFDKWLTQEEYSNQYELRKFCPDGSSIVNHEGQDCSKPLITPEGFTSQGIQYERATSLDGLIPIALLVGIGAVIYMRYRD